ncbi:MAG TPA: serine/threonine-protein kinase, partial [Polyangiaceae bacterium]|nr:serine/threonine-protein kinase [Polyangiaceae bacterium]
VDETPAGLPFLVMEFLAGHTLRDELARHRQLPIEDAVRYVREACEGVDEAHRAGIIHRDLKPANLFLSLGADESVVKVVDFGIAKTLDAAPSDFQTETNTPLGTYRYMSPEQAKSPRAVDARSDIWSLGVVLYQLLAGRTPFSGEGVVGILFAIATQPPRPLRSVRGDAPEALVAVIERTLSKDPAGRQASARELADELAPFGGPPLVARPLSTLPPGPLARPAVAGAGRASRPSYAAPPPPAAPAPDHAPASPLAETELGLAPTVRARLTPTDHPFNDSTIESTAKGLAPDQYLPAPATPAGGSGYPRPAFWTSASVAPAGPHAYPASAAHAAPAAPPAAAAYLTPPATSWPYGRAGHEPGHAEDTSSEKGHTAQITSATSPHGTASRRSALAVWLVAGVSSVTLGLSISAGIFLVQARSGAKSTPVSSATTARALGSAGQPIASPVAAPDAASPPAPAAPESLRGQAAAPRPSTALPEPGSPAPPETGPTPAALAPNAGDAGAERAAAEASAKPSASASAKPSRARPNGPKPATAASPEGGGAAASKPSAPAERGDVRRFD